MAENWLELYNQPKDTKRKSGDPEFDVFMELSENSHANFNSKDAWNCVKEKLQSNSQRPNWFKTHGWKVAATVTLLLASVIIFTQIGITSIDNTVSLEASERAQNITLPDGSQIFLSQGATLSYTKPFQNREIFFKGLGYFEIQKNDSPFIIHLDDQSIKVLGTAFSVNSNQETIQVYVAEGVVQFASTDSKEIININEQLTYDVTRGISTKIQNSNPNVLSWKTGKFVFKDTPFTEAIQYLEKYYNVTFGDTDRFKRCYITARFDSEDLNQVLTILEPILDVRFEQNNSIIQTVGKGCN